MADPLKQRQIETKTIYRGKPVSLREDQVRLPTGQEVTRVVVDHPGAVVVIPRLPNGNLLLVRQWRYAVGEALLELPAGGLEPGEPPEVTAARELQEEVGMKPGRLTKLAEFYTAPGFCNEFMHLYLAEGLTPSQLPPDADEQLEVVELSLSEALAHPAAQRDAKTLVGLLLLKGL